MHRQTVLAIRSLICMYGTDLNKNANIAKVPICGQAVTLFAHRRRFYFFMFISIKRPDSVVFALLSYIRARFGNARFFIYLWRVLFIACANRRCTVSMLCSIMVDSNSILYCGIFMNDGINVFNFVPGNSSGFHSLSTVELSATCNEVILLFVQNVLCKCSDCVFVWWTCDCF